MKEENKEVDIDEGIVKLGHAIVKMAAQDYMTAMKSIYKYNAILKKNKNDKEALARMEDAKIKVDELEGFFTGQWCHALCGKVSGSYILKGLKKKAEEKYSKKYGSL